MWSFAFTIHTPNIQGGQTALKAHSQNLNLRPCVSGALTEGLGVRVDRETDHKAGTRRQAHDQNVSGVIPHGYRVRMEKLLLIYLLCNFWGKR